MSLENSVDILEQIPFFEDFSDERLRLLAFGGETRHYNHGDVLLHAGDLTDGGFVILRGTVAFFSHGDLDTRPSGLTGAPSLIGQRALLTQTRPDYTACAKGPVDVLVLRRPLFMRMLSEYPDLASALYNRLSRELGGMSSSMAVTSAALKRNLPENLRLPTSEELREQIARHETEHHASDSNETDAKKDDPHQAQDNTSHNGVFYSKIQPQAAHRALKKTSDGIQAA